MKSMNFPKMIYGLNSIGERGQVVVPKKIRQAMNLKDGQEILFLYNGHGVIMLPAAKLDFMARQFSSHAKQINKLLNNKKRLK